MVFDYWGYKRAGIWRAFQRDKVPAEATFLHPSRLLRQTFSVLEMELFVYSVMDWQ